MNQKKIFGISTLAVLGMTLGFAFSSAVIAQADTTPPVATCGVPVCDMQAAIAAIRTGTEGSRFATITGFIATYKNETKLAVLNNLADFAKQAEAVLSEVYPATDAVHAYVVREAHTLYGDMMIGLAKFSPLNASVLAGYYSQISSEDSRFAVLLYWHGRISEFDDKESLLALLDFFGKVEAITRAANNADYLVREARSDEDTITARLVQLYPYFEGTYKIHVTCTIATGEDAPLYCQDNFIDRLVIMDTMGSNGIQVTLANTASNTMMYTFTNAVLSGGGSTFEAQGTPSGVLSQLHVELDRATGKIKGFVRNSDSLSSLQLDGSLDASPSSVYDLQSRAPHQEALTADQIAGVYKGKYAGRDVTFSLVQFAAGAVGGTMSFDDQAAFKLRFQTSRFYTKLGVLVLVANTTSGAHVKLTAYFGKTDKGFTVQGFGFTDLSGATQTLDLTSVAQH